MFNKTMTKTEIRKIKQNTMEKKLTRSEAVYVAIREFEKNNHYQPTQTEIANITGRSNVGDVIRSLVNTGFLDVNISKNGTYIGRTYRTTNVVPPNVVKKFKLPKTMLPYIQGFKVGDKRTIIGDIEAMKVKFAKNLDHFKFYENKHSVRVHRIK